MRYLLSIMMFLISSLPSLADELSETILKNLSQRVDSHNSYSVDFSVSEESRMPRTLGSFIVCGDNYYIKVADTEIFYDGKKRYTYNRTDNEVVVERVLPTEESLLTNPTKIFKLYDSNFTHKMAEVQSRNGMSQIELTPQNLRYRPITLFVNKQTGLPDCALTTLDESGIQLLFKIDEIRFDVGVDKNTFIFDRKKHPGVEVIEF